MGTIIRIFVMTAIVTAWLIIHSHLAIRRSRGHRYLFAIYDIREGVVREAKPGEVVEIRPPGEGYLKDRDSNTQRDPSRDAIVNGSEDKRDGE